MTVVVLEAAGRWAGAVDADGFFLTMGLVTDSATRAFLRRCQGIFPVSL